MGPKILDGCAAGRFCWVSLIGETGAGAVCAKAGPIKPRVTAAQRIARICEARILSDIPLLLLTGSSIRPGQDQTALVGLPTTDRPAMIHRALGTRWPVRVNGW